MFYLYTITYSNICAFGGRPRQFSGLSAYDQLLFSDEDFFFFSDRSMDHAWTVVFFLSLFCFVFQPSFAHSTKAQTKLRQPQYLRTTSYAEQPAIGPAQSIKVQTIVRSCRSEGDNASKRTRAKVLPRAKLFFLCSSLLLSLSECCVITSPTTHLDFSPSTAHFRPRNGLPSYTIFSPEYLKV